MKSSHGFTFSMVKCSVLLALFVLVNVTNVYAYSIGNYTFCRDVDKSSTAYKPIDGTDVFYDTDEKIIFLIQLQNVVTHHTTYTKWFTPKGDLLERIDVEIPDPRTSGYDYWTDFTCYYVQDSPERKMPGLWRVEFYVDGSFVLTDSYEMQSTAPATTTERTSAESTITSTYTSSVTISTTSILTVTKTIREEQQITGLSLFSNPLYILTIMLAIAAITLTAVMARRTKTRGYEQRKPVAGFCANCGAPLAPGITFCGSCGKRLT